MTVDRLPRPRRAAMPVAASAAVLVVWWVVAHDAGTGWVQAIGALVAGALVVGMLAPAVGVWRVRCRIVSSPHDASAGSAVALEVSSSAPVELQAIDPPGPAVLTGRAARTRLEVCPARRGVLDRCTVVVASAAPFGILWWSRTVELALPRPLAVAPRVGTRQATSRVDRGPTETLLAAPGRGGEPRGARPYQRGDRRTLVHWRATAHTGSLMVRETERPGPRLAIVDGRLPPEPAAAEHHAERVMATIRALLLDGTRVELETVEPSGEILAPVTSLAAAGRRLALALPRVGATAPRPRG